MSRQIIMTPLQIAYFNYATDDELVQKQIRDTGIRSIRMNRICGRCEKVAFTHMIGVQCHSCGHFSAELTPYFKDHLMDIETLR